MTPRTLVGSLLVVTACGGTYYDTLTAAPTTGPAETIECVRSRLGKSGYQQIAYDAVDYRVVARKTDNATTRADPRFRRRINRIEAQAAATAGGRTELKVVGHTFVEYSTHRGPTATEERASDDVSQTAQAVVEDCGRP